MDWQLAVPNRKEPRVTVDHAPAEHGRADPARPQYEPSYLRRLLTEAGLGSVVSARKVAASSGRRLNRDWVRTLLLPIPAGQRGPRYDVESLHALSDTLQRLGIRVSFPEIERAVLADLRFPMAVSSYENSVSDDPLAEVLHRIELLSDEDLRRLLVHVSALLAPAEEVPARAARE